MTNHPNNIVVVCEGESERTYLQRLNSFLASQPIPEGWSEVPVHFIGRPPRTGVGTGFYKAVERELRKEARQNPSVEKWVWIDADLYVRNDRNCGDSYRHRPLSVAPFRFSVFNFEDFLALHLDATRFARWVELMTKAGHFKKPLHWEVYKKLFLEVIPDYQKASLPSDFISWKSLGRLRMHLKMLPLLDYGNLTIEASFAHSMLDEITRWYAPDLLTSGQQGVDNSVN